jgi:hypothetical protein
MRLAQSSLLAAAIAAIVASCAASAREPKNGLEDMVGARAGQSEAELQRRGYRNVRSEKGDDRSYAYWWNADKRQCVTIATMNGRYDSITSTPAPDCRHSASGAPHHSAEREDYSRPSGSMAFAGDLPRYCKGEASAAFDRRPSEITTNAPIKQRSGYLVQGWFDGDKRTTFFNCRFDVDGRFLSVN